MNDAPTAGAPARPPMTKMQKLYAIIGGALLLIALIAAWALRGGDQLTYVTAKVQQGEIHDAVDATGTVNAVVTVQVGSQVSGSVAKLNADFNSRVKKGEVIALIEPSLFDGAVLQATADVESAKANVTAAEANGAMARAALVPAKAAYERTVSLEKQRVQTQQDLEAAKAAYESARASVDASAANVVQARAQVSQKEAALSVARTNLDHTVIRSPIDGIVVARNVDVGQTVAASLQAPTVFTIAQDLTKMQLYAKTDESDVGRVRVGQQVTFKVDAFPKELFNGVVSQMRMNATTVQNVVTYDAIIDFQNPELKLFPGMTAYVTIPVATVRDAVKLPNAALRFKPPFPPELIQALYAKFGVDERPPAGKAPRAESAVVWKLVAGNAIEPVKVSLGITDHAYTDITAQLGGRLKPGDEVVTTALPAKSSAPGAPGVRR
jgi:HlyD family secretion protein